MFKDKSDLNIIQIQLYGELYGGNYLGVKNIKGSKSVQKGIYYSNSNEFAFFDLKYWTGINCMEYKWKYKQEQEQEQKQEHIQTGYLDWDDFENILFYVSIPIVPIISKSKWNTIIKLYPQFESVVYRLHNLPQIPSNYAEGYIIKHVKEIRYGEG